MENLTEVVLHAMSGGLFTYLSYDHHKAEAEYRQTNWFKDYESEYIRVGNVINYGPLKVSKHDIPVEIRDKYPVWKKGKLRRVEFNNFGDISRVYVGSKFAISFYKSDLHKLNKSI